MHHFLRVIDSAIELCGSQNAAARAINCDKSAFSKVRAAKHRLNAEQIGALAKLVGSDPAEVWEDQAAFYASMKNPFRRAPLSTVACVILSLSVGAPKTGFAQCSSGLTSEVGACGQYAHWRKRRRHQEAQRTTRPGGFFYARLTLSLEHAHA